MSDGPLSLFGDATGAELEAVLARLERRTFAAGSAVISAGDSPRELYVVLSGSAVVVIADRDGSELRVAEIKAGEPVGEISMLTGQPAAATVRAAEELEVAVLGEQELEELTESFPQIHRNLGAFLARRLARTNRLAVRRTLGRVSLLEPGSARPLLGVELAASIAWHTRRPTALLVSVVDPDEGLRKLAGTERSDGVRIELLEAGGPADALPARVGELREHFDNVIVQSSRPGEWSPPDSRTVSLAASMDAETLARQARELAGLRVGIALGGGSLRGYAHLGALNVFERRGIPIDFLSGASVGATVAGLYALGNDTARCADLLDLLGDAMVRPALPRNGLLSPRALRKLMREHIPHERIEDLPIPLGVVTADIETQEEVILRSGNLGLALLAATALPGIYPPVRLGGRTLVDGGVLNPVPASVVAEMGADVVVAVRLGSLALHPVEGRADETAGPLPSIVTVIRRSIELMQTRIGIEAPTVPSAMITPEFPELPSGRLRNFRLGRRYIQAGEEAAEAALPRIAALLPWLRA